MLHCDFTRRPISKENPCGVNPVRLDEFDEIKRQINNLNKVTGKVSWKKVLELSKTILTSHSKDFRCSCYYTVAATHLNGLSGLYDGLNSVLDLCVVYWYSAYPEHSKSSARISTIEWMIENAEKRLNKHKPQPEERQVIEAIHQLCLKIEEELRLHYGIKAPSFGRIRRLLSQWLDSLKELELKEIARKESVANKPVLKTVEQASSTIKVDVTPTFTANQPVAKKASHSTNSSSLIILAIVLVIAVAVAAHFSFRQYQFESMKTRIENASIDELARVITSKKYISINKDASLRATSVDRVDTLMSDWTSDAVKVSQAETLGRLTAELIELYPDSSSALMLRERFLQQSSNLESEFNALFRKFSSARTVFANVVIDNPNRQSSMAYEYSNSLFPLLGRIDYAEKNNNSEELDQSIRLLNIYLYKINQLKLIEK
ncbi:type VI secretion system ImpA family N-terminal domain-containing protein [Vibrio maritimus]|uniref:type VI secretion system ImpA family N-terminal domain-containing protein n=1 Tax=Vibrio maritimus TaxID=990268 RepID=UPI001F19720B|nr:type VI secretion system ImpA family N-terminal domain-containing protein [Vibrio maritimus]